ncbi:MULTISPECIES: alpha/beta fold hydrolase [unclassified Microbacterium]|uniref:alpha/beta fold hydrolase n=1 Tax=unclassified Microbacterium TaxID=2609290 RepID=UPI00386818C0
MACVSDAAFDEFSFLPGQAAALGVPLPSAERTEHRLGDGRTVSALRYGDPGAAQITYLHGAGLNAHTWDTTVLATRLPALALDLPGHGDSSWRGDGGYSGRQLAEDVAPVIAAWADRPQVVVGHSLGGLTAAALAATHPELVAALVIVDISPGIDPNGGAAGIRQFFAGPTDWATRDELVDRALAFGLGGSRESAERGVFLNSRVRSDGRVEWKHHFAHLANRLAADPAAAAAVDEHERASSGILSAAGWEHLAAVRVPLTLIRGTRGFVTADDRDEYARRVPAARIVDIDTGHNVQEERPAELAELIAGVARELVAAEDGR